MVCAHQTSCDGLSEQCPPLLMWTVEDAVQPKVCLWINVVRGLGDLYPPTGMLKPDMTQSLPTALQVSSGASLIRDQKI